MFPIAICCPAGHGTGPVTGSRSIVAWTPSNGATWVRPCRSTETRSASGGTDWSAITMAAVLALPM